MEGSGRRVFHSTSSIYIGGTFFLSFYFTPYPFSLWVKYIYVMLGYRYSIGETRRGLVVSGTHIYSGLVRVEFEFSSLGMRDEIEVKPRSLGKTRHQRDSCVFVFFQAYRVISDNSADYASGDNLTA